MSRHMSADEFRNASIRDMGEDLGAVYLALYSELAWLHAKWNQYRRLYARSTARLELLNQDAPRFFRTLQLTLLQTSSCMSAG
jgi:hypothetical protein